MASPYFDASTVQVADGTRADAPDVNNVSNAIDAGLQLLPDPDPLNEDRVSTYTNTGSGSNYLVSTGLPVTVYTDGLGIEFVATFENGVGATVDVDGVGPVAIVYTDGTPIDAGAIPLGAYVILKAAGGVFQYRVRDSSANAAAAAGSATDAANSATDAANSASAAAASAASANSTPQWIIAAQEGSDLNISGLNTPTLSSLSGTDVAYFDIGNTDLRTYRFDYVAGTWAQVGNDLNLPTKTGFASLTALNSTRIALLESNTDELQAYDWDGADWSAVGNPFTITGPATGAITSLSSSRVVLIDNSTDELQTYDFDGADWSAVGNGLSVAAGIPSIGALSATEIAFIDSTSDELRKYTFDGTDWTLTGSGLSFTAASDLVALNGTDVAAVDNTNLGTYRFDGATWSKIGNEFNISGASGASMSALNGSDIAFIDGSNADLRVYRFSFWTGDGPFNQTLL